jgi:hypothetical protein
VDNTHIEAISFIPMHFRTSWIIILSFPLSPVSPESGTEMGRQSSAAGVTCCLDADAIIDSSGGKDRRAAERKEKRKKGMERWDALEDGTEGEAAE